MASADVADVVADLDLLGDPSWTGTEGGVVREPVDHTPRQMASIMTEVLGRPVGPERVSLEEHRAQLAALGASPAVAAAMVEMAAAQEAGVYPPVQPGGSGTAFEQWCAETLLPAVRGTPGQ